MYIHKFKKIVLIISMIFLVVLTSCQAKDSSEGAFQLTEEVVENQPDNVELKPIVGYIGDEIPLLYKEMVRAFALSMYDKNEIEKVSSGTDFEFKNISSEDIEYKYIATLIENKYIDFDENCDFNKEVTLEDLNNILSRLPDNDYSLKVEDANKDKVVSYGFFSKILIKTMESIATGGITEEFDLSYSEEVILATSKENKEIPNGKIITDFGVREASFLNYSSLLNHSINFLLKDNEIIVATEVTSSTPTIKSAFITDNSVDSISIFTGGVNRIYKVSDGIDEDLSGKLCNIMIQEDKALEVTVLGNFINDEIKLINSTKILFENKGVYDMSNNIHTLKFYDISSGKVKSANSGSVYVGNNNIDFVYSESKVIGGIIKEKNTFSEVRVLLNNSDFNNTFFDSVTFSGKLTIDGVEKDSVTITSNDLELYGFKKITSTDGIIFDSIKRNVTGGVPKYQGHMEVIKTEKGLVVVNQLSIEDYLKKVVPSEMPSSYNIEALKAQAVSARTFAVKQIQGQVYQKYGAMLDDSTSSQVYNNIDETEKSKEAVESTKGEVLVYNGDVISTNFFSTSSGFTANSGEVWGDNGTLTFPTTTPEYLRSQSLLKDNLKVDFGNEEEVLNFYKNKDIKAVDSNVGWFRWETSLTYKDIETNISNFVPSRMEVVPYLFDTDFDFSTGQFTGIKTIEILSRGENGIVLEILIKNDSNYLKVSGEYNIRKVLAPTNTALLQRDGSTINNYSLLPSGFFAFVKNAEDITIYGGGNGHGVGLSQNGANTLGAEGKDYNQILETFYKNVDKIKLK